MALALALAIYERKESRESKEGVGFSFGLNLVESLEFIVYRQHYKS